MIPAWHLSLCMLICARLWSRARATRIDRVANITYILYKVYTKDLYERERTNVNITSKYLDEWDSMIVIEGKIPNFFRGQMKFSPSFHFKSLKIANFTINNINYVT